MNKFVLITSIIYITATQGSTNRTMGYHKTTRPFKLNPTTQGTTPASNPTVRIISAEEKDEKARHRTLSESSVYLGAKTVKDFKIRDEHMFPPLSASRPTPSPTKGFHFRKSKTPTTPSAVADESQVLPSASVEMPKHTLPIDQSPTPSFDTDSQAKSESDSSTIAPFKSNIHNGNTVNYYKFTRLQIEESNKLISDTLINKWESFISMNILPEKDDYTIFKVTTHKK